MGRLVASFFGAPKASTVTARPGRALWWIVGSIAAIGLTGVTTRVRRRIGDDVGVGRRFRTQVRRIIAMVRVSGAVTGQVLQEIELQVRYVVIQIWFRAVPLVICSQILGIVGPSVGAARTIVLFFEIGNARVDGRVQVARW